MGIGKILKKNITYCEPETKIAEVARIMKEDDVGTVLVLEAGVPKGIITDRDIVLRSVAEHLDSKTTPVERIMTRGVETVTSDQGIYDVAHKMKSASVRRIVVVDGSGNALGVLSFDDVFDLLTEELNDLREAVQPRKHKIVSEAA